MSDFNIKRFSKSVCDVDNDLGMFSDYEGDESGTTFRMHQEGKEAWGHYCDRAILLHEKALRLWKRAKKSSEGGSSK